MRSPTRTRPVVGLKPDLPLRIAFILEPRRARRSGFSPTTRSGVSG